MKTWMGKLRLVLLLLTMPCINIFYGLLNNPDRGVKSLVTDIDRGVPFIKAFVIPYLFWIVFIFIILIYLLIKDEKTFVRTILTIDVCLVFCFTIYYFFQTTVPRPVVDGSDLLSRLVNTVYYYDQPFNCFPSIHCLTSYIMIKAISQSNIRNRINFSIITLISVLIILSTMFIKQHVVLDAISAIIIGNGVFETFTILYKEQAAQWTRKQSSSLMMKRKLET
ncbi:MAG: phosphatase PAP2 family protein [Clostridia bacterium]|nr:phosphatase PAP2 family protein [Clostridia bacterium]